MGMFFHLGGGTRIFSRGQSGGPTFFAIGEGGDQNFFTYAKGGPEKIGDRPSQTDGPPLPVKNDSSLKGEHSTTLGWSTLHSYMDIRSVGNSVLPFEWMRSIHKLAS